jgi:hypothetical protein
MKCSYRILASFYLLALFLGAGNILAQSVPVMPMCGTSPQPPFCKTGTITLAQLVAQSLGTDGNSRQDSRALA